MKKKLIACLLIISMLSQQFIMPARAAAIQSSARNATYSIVLMLDSPFIDTPMRKKALVVDGEIMLDAATIGHLTGYECSYWGDTIIFERGFRKIAVNPDGGVRYYYTDSNLKLSKVVVDNDHVYIPFSAGLRMLSSVELAVDDKILVLSNKVSLVDNYLSWDMTNAVFDFDRDLPVKSVKGVKLGIFMSTIFEKGFTYVINAASAQGPNADKYRDAAIYYMTYENENATIAALESEAELFDRALTYFGSDLNKMAIKEIKGLPSYLADPDLVLALEGLDKVSEYSDYATPLFKTAIMYSKLKESKPPQIQSLKAAVRKPDGSSQSGLGLSLYRGVENAIAMAEKRYIHSVMPVIRDTTRAIIDNSDKINAKERILEKLLGKGAGAVVGSTLTGFTLGNAVMQLAFKGEFEKMDKYDLAFCLKDMQDKTLMQYNICAERIRDGSTDVNDYIYVYNAMQFLNNSNIAICQLLTEIYESKKTEPGVKSMISHWRKRIADSGNHFYANNITLESCIRDAIPTDLINFEGKLEVSDLSAAKGPVRQSNPSTTPSAGTDLWMAYNSKYIFYFDMNGLWKMNKDGTGKTKLSNAASRFFHVDETNVYISTESHINWETIPVMLDDDDIFENITSINVETGEVDRIANDVACAYAIDGAVYYSAPDLTQIRMIDFTDGAKPVTILDFAREEKYGMLEWVDEEANQLIVSTVGFRDAEDYDKREMLRYSLYGDYIGRYDLDAESMVVSGALPNGGLTYAERIPGDPNYLSNLYLKDVAGTQNLISDAAHESFYVFEEYIYYWQFENAAYNLYRIDQTGANRQKLSVAPSAYSEHLYYNDGYIYFVKDENKIYRMSMDGTDYGVIHEISSEPAGAWGDLCFADGWMGIYDGTAGYGMDFYEFDSIVNLEKVQSLSNSSSAYERPASTGSKTASAADLNGYFAILKMAAMEFDYERAYNIYTSSDFIAMYTEAYNQNREDMHFKYAYNDAEDDVVSIDIFESASDGQDGIPEYVHFTVWGKNGEACRISNWVSTKTKNTSGIHMTWSEYSADKEPNGIFRDIFQYDGAENGEIEMGITINGIKDGISSIERVDNGKTTHKEYSNGQYVFVEEVLQSDGKVAYTVSPGDHTFVSSPEYDYIQTITLGEYPKAYLFK